MQKKFEFIKSECKCCNPTELGDYKVRNRTTGVACAPWPLALLPTGVPLQGFPLARSVAPGRSIFNISNLGQLLAKESVKTWFCSPASAMVPCANVRNRTTGTSCAPRPLALLPHGAPSRGSQRRAGSLHFRRGLFCVPLTAHRCTCLCKCLQTDD